MSLSENMHNLKKTLNPVVDQHSDERRDLVAVFNGDFTAKQLKIATMHKDAKLGWHYHNYEEWFTVLNGKATFRMFDINNPTWWVVTKVITPGNVLKIPAQVAHDAMVDANTTLIGFTAEQYISPDVSDVKFSIDDVIQKAKHNLIVNLRARKRHRGRGRERISLWR